MRLRQFVFLLLLLMTWSGCSLGQASRKPGSNGIRGFVRFAFGRSLGFWPATSCMGADRGREMSIWRRSMRLRSSNRFGLEPGLAPAGENGGYIQRAPLPNPLPEKLAERLKKHGFDQNQRTDTWNALALLRGTDAGAAPGPVKDVILLTAHLDHLGLGEGCQRDSIYNGADDRCLGDDGCFGVGADAESDCEWGSQAKAVNLVCAVWVGGAGRVWEPVLSRPSASCP